MLPKAVEKLLADPPAGSKVRAAREYGVDLSITVRNMFGLTPEERLQSLQNGADSLAFLKKRGGSI